jgi:hypothetical protein
MKKHLALATAAALFASVSAAGINALHADTPSTDPADWPVAPGHTTGMVVQIDPAGTVISVDGIDYHLADEVSAAGLEIGDEVTVTYEAGDVPGLFIATEITAATADMDPATADMGAADPALDHAGAGPGVAVEDGTSPAQTAARELDRGMVTAGEATGLMQEVDALGGIIVVDGVRYLLDDSIDPAGLSAGELVTVSFEESELGTELLATEVVPAAQ